MTALTVLTVLFAVVTGAVIGIGIGMLQHDRASGTAFIATALALILLRLLVMLR